MQVKLVINQTNYKVVLISRGIFSSQKIGKRLNSLIKKSLLALLLQLGKAIA